MSRRKVATALALAAAVLAASALAFPRLPAAARLDPSAFAGVRPGMTEAEVERLLGVPAGDYGTLALLKPLARRMAKGEKAWCDDRAVLFVTFDGRGVATDVKRLDWKLDPSMTGFSGLVHRARVRLGL